jgi:hypothetical protein
VAGLLFKDRREFLGRRRKVGGHGHVHFGGAHGKGGPEQGDGEGGFDKTHDFLPMRGQKNEPVFGDFSSENAIQTMNCATLSHF